MIINNYVHLLGPENFNAIFIAIQNFSLYPSENINQNFTAIGMFISVADYVAQVQRNGNSEVDSSKIWKSMFGKMQAIGVFQRGDIRRSLIQTLENIIISHAQTFSTATWLSILTECQLQIVEVACKNLIDKLLH